MLFRVRASLRDRPGALAELATRCGDAGLNILGLQIFPDLGTVTDELVISAPEAWTARAVAELVGGAGGDEVSVEPCTTHDLIDQPTRWLTAAADVVAGTARLPELLERLLGPHPEKWSPTEHSRAAALGALAKRVRESVGREPVAPAVPAPTGSGAGAVQYAEVDTGVEAWIGRYVVGRARLVGDEELTIEVDPSWRRLGIGTSLLHRACTVAAARGREHVVLVAPASDEGFVGMVCGAGMRARIRMRDGALTARIGLAGRTRGQVPEPSSH
ncbi:GNAT family N-acetyltransferase [Nocardioides aequoreus]|uniref:GNAT family N-acetyltransferase n=1 Tax=Nocardioides aequoreus TaxID=397278 RepID=UPI0004C44051|nr:GNAT family N-acetyltransferase [Nocardioides aequoreus]